MESHLNLNLNKQTIKRMSTGVMSVYSHEYLLVADSKDTTESELVALSAVGRGPLRRGPGELRWQPHGRLAQGRNEDAHLSPPPYTTHLHSH